MGVIKRVLYRGTCLGKPRHRNLFLDMEENIHIHYRDLRIELSRAEFEEICETFRKQSRELQAIIHEKGYEDGLLANANQEDVRIWTESQLAHEIRYHPRRLSLEACSDGYHLHFRNCKFLLDEAEFRNLVRAFQGVDVDGPCATSYAEVLELLKDNDVDFTLDAGNVADSVLAIAVAAYHLPKIREIFKLIGFSQESRPDGVTVYQGAQLQVLARADRKNTTQAFRHLRGLDRTQRLAEFLAREGSALHPDTLNRIKCQVLDLYYALRANQKLPVQTDPAEWLYAAANQQVIFPYTPTPCDAQTAAKTMYKAWSALTGTLGLSFIKPGKLRFPPDQQAELHKRVTETLFNEVASRAAVEKIFLMGSALRQEMGRYRAPFVHGPQAKLGSDIDILVEIHPDREADIPATWQLINPDSSSGCAVYHIIQLPMTDGVAEWTSRHPHIPFTHHLVDAYLFFPSRSRAPDKEAFLRKFNAQLFYDRQRDGTIPAPGAAGSIATQIETLFGLSPVVVEPLRVSTENSLYKVFAGEREAILKLFKVAGNHHRAQVAEHTVYEARLIDQLIARNVPTAAIFPPRSGNESGIRIDGFPALLFERLRGEPNARPEYPLAAIGQALALLHRVQLEQPLALPETFSFEHTCQIWLPHFDIYHRDPAIGPALVAAFDALAPFARTARDEESRRALLLTSPAVHCHGDVTPKNVIIEPDGRCCLFDFNNCFHGPRLLDLLDGCFEFSLADKYIHLADFARFDALLGHYAAHAPLTDAERTHLDGWIGLLGVIKFTKEVRVLLERPGEELRRQRALALAGFLQNRLAG